MTDLETLTSQQHSSLGTDHLEQSDRLLLIDGDAIAYMIGWNYKDYLGEEAQFVREMVTNSVDQWMRDFFTLVDCKTYLGVLSAEANRQNFRYSIYKYKPYKGNRGEDPDWIKQWKPVINQHLIERWQFVRAPEYLETDDVIAGMAYNNKVEVQKHQIETEGYIGYLPLVCSPDKDLKQLSGHHYCYKTGKDTLVSERDALWNWCMQMLCGDEVDGISGVPGLGPKKSEALLKTAETYVWINLVKLAYQRYFGNYYGDIIYEETRATVTLMTPAHPLWETFGFDVGEYKSRVVTSG